MSKFITSWNVGQLKENRALLVPSIFTERQFVLLQKRLQQKALTPTERAYFSRTITKKIRAMECLSKEKEPMLVYGENEMLSERKKRAIKILKRIERNHKNQKILISGSFLYSQKYQDIDIFILSKYQKEDYRDGKLHFNYLSPEAAESLLFHSLGKICISNFSLDFLPIKEKIDLNLLISKYQEVIKDCADKNSSWLKIDLRDFILFCYYAGSKVVLSSKELKQISESLAKKKKISFLLKNLFIQTLLQGFNKKTLFPLSLRMLKSYRELKKEYKQPEYYNFLMQSFKEVLAYAG